MTDFPMVATSTLRGASARAGSAARVAGGGGVYDVFSAVGSGAGVKYSSSFRVDFHISHSSVKHLGRRCCCHQGASEAPSNHSHEDTEGFVRRPTLFHSND